MKPHPETTTTTMRKLKLILNDAQNMISYFLRSDLGLGQPSVLAIETTNNCNFKCKMCPVGTGKMKRSKEFMDYSLFKKIIDENKDYISLVWLSNFGEPLLHPMIFTFIEYCKKNRVRCGIFTNGSLLKEDASKNLIESGIDKVVISIDSVNSETYQSIKGVPKFEQVVENAVRLIRFLKAERNDNPQIIVQFIPMTANEKEIRDFCKFWLNQGAYVNLHSFRTWGGQLKDANELTRPQYTIGYGREKRLPCGEPWRHLVILWDGTVVPCCCDYDGVLSLGNVNSATLSEIWNGEKMRKFRRLHKDERWGEIPLCRDCTDWYGFHILDKNLLHKTLRYFTSYVFKGRRVEPKLTSD